MRYAIIILLLLFPLASEAQKKVLKEIDKAVTADEALAHLSFLASDEMRGRNTGSNELDIAASYIATQFKLHGIKPAPGMADYYQIVDLQKNTRPSSLEVSVGPATFKLMDDLLLINGKSAVIESQMVFVGYGTTKDFDQTDVKGKIAVTYAGAEGIPGVFNALMEVGPEKQKLAASRGAVALLEIFAIPGAPWQAVNNFLSAGRTILKMENSIPHIWMKNSKDDAMLKLIESRQSIGRIALSLTDPKSFNGKNVISAIEGTDAKLKNEWIVVSAHYDHVGVKKGIGQDSIYNGARDNAIGTVAVLEAAKYFATHPSKRSILFVALTAEEVGLLGSTWYAGHPVVPLKQTIFNLNCDGAGYNDKTIATVIDLNRTSTDELLTKACASQRLLLKGDPAPEQKLYDRSDNVNFAKAGVPAVNISPGIKSFDQELFKFYHQPADEVGSLDMVYLEKFFRSFVYAVYLLGDDSGRPTWKSGDKYEAAGKSLYGM